MDDAERVLRLQLLATVARVSSIVAAFFSRITRDEDAFPVDATVQSAWRELQGDGDESQRRDRWREVFSLPAVLGVDRAASRRA